MSETIERLTRARDAALDACRCTLDHGDMVTLTDIVVKLTVIINLRTLCTKCHDIVHHDLGISHNIDEGSQKLLDEWVKTH